jgi:hypothetical protein
MSALIEAQMNVGRREEDADNQHHEEMESGPRRKSGTRE